MILGVARPNIVTLGVSLGVTLGVTLLDPAIASYQLFNQL